LTGLTALAGVVALFDAIGVSWSTESFGALNLKQAEALLDA
jgi:hypothetical protein